ncbi:hypothetical protein JCM10207_005201 [Rhodosporidiobolus poonsookiae]
MATQHEAAELLNRVVHTPRSYFVLLDDFSRPELAVQSVAKPAEYTTKVGTTHTATRMESTHGTDWTDLYDHALLIQAAATNPSSKRYIKTSAVQLVQSFKIVDIGTRYIFQDCETFLKKMINWHLAVDYRQVLDNWGRDVLRPLQPNFTAFALTLYPKYLDGYHISPEKKADLVRSLGEYITKHGDRLGGNIFCAAFEEVVRRPLAGTRYEARARVWKSFVKELGKVLKAKEKARRRSEDEILSHNKIPEGWPNPSVANTLDILRHAPTVWQQILHPEEVPKNRSSRFSPQAGFSKIGLDQVFKRR